ncbi:hypothetical protein BSK52_00250 [Paenibacillus odorifer]|uniref:Uncharacterized protein n=2 Tax=Paenibacillus odorifer TaxID=189426 RepID=A0A1R0Y9I1_9BACL|nr:hypothetical protein BSK52_00250 [Paenibacillus odorifer]
MEIVNMKQFAEKQGISLRTARRWVRQGLPRIKVMKQGKCLIDLEKAEGWMLQRKKKQSPDCLSIQQAANVSGVHRNTIRYWLRTNMHFREKVVIPEKTSYMISKQGLEDWINKQTSGSTKGGD